MPRRPALSLSLYLRGRKVLLVGTGAGADERAERLKHARAELQRASEDEWRQEPLADYFLVVAHSASEAANLEVARSAREAGCLCYAHDQPAVSDFAFPALATRGSLSVAITTDATAPSLAGSLRRQLQSLLDQGGDELDALLEALESSREALPPGTKRQKLLKRMAQSVRLVGAIEVDPLDTP